MPIDSRDPTKVRPRMRLTRTANIVRQAADWVPLF